MGGFLGGIPLPGIGGGLPSLPTFPSPTGGFLPCTICPGCCGSGGSGGTGTKTTTPTGPTIPGTNIPIIIPLPGSGSPAPGKTTTPGSGSITLNQTGLSSSALGFLSSPIGYLFGTSLTRLAFFILGIVALIGAVYLYKDTRFLVAGPLNAAKSAAKNAARTASEAAAA